MLYEVITRLNGVSPGYISSTSLYSFKFIRGVVARARSSPFRGSITIIQKSKRPGGLAWIDVQLMIGFLSEFRDAIADGLSYNFV